MRLNDIIKSMQAPEAGQVKEAEEKAPTAVQSTQAELGDALAKAAGDSSAKKEAEAQTPAETLMSSAVKLAAAEREANREEARMLGAAFADGCIAKLAAAEKAAMELGIRPQGLQPTSQVSATQYKTAAEIFGTDADDDTLRKTAAEAGYQYALEKIAEEYSAGHDAAAQEVVNMAADEFIKGAAETQIVLQMHRAQQSQNR